jgi:hypothetical protein
MSSPIQESAPYDNFLNVETRLSDKYANTLENFLGEPIETALKTPRKDPYADLYGVTYVNLYSLDDVYDFCIHINQLIPGNKKEAFFPEYESTIFGIEEKKIHIDKELIKPSYGRNKKNSNVDTDLSDFLDDNIQEGLSLIKKHGYNSSILHWKYMPKMKQENKHAYRRILMKFRKEEDYKQFEELIGQTITKRDENSWTPIVSYPKKEKKQSIKLRWLAEPLCNPKYPMYIVSKNRHETMYTSRCLSRMHTPHYIIVEPQNMEDYDKALDNFNIREFVTLIEAPFSNHGDGPGRARNFAWDHSISIGATSHWVLDDNIYDFYRLHNNEKIRMSTAAGFKAMEDFVDRYDNIYISGPNYVFFCAETQKYEPYVPNTRIYSTLLIRNDCKHRWRGRYNEDTDICLRVLKDGDCTAQFNIFLQGKAATQTVKGGNTEEFYHAENADNKEAWRNSYLNAEGTVNKSKMLVDMHPDVAVMMFRYGRWHHYVDYTPFVKNEFKLKPGLEIPEGINEYGMYMIDNYDKEAITIGAKRKK